MFIMIILLIEKTRAKDKTYKRLFRLRTNCSDKTNKQIGNVFVSQFVLISVLLFSVAAAPRLQV